MKIVCLENDDDCEKIPYINSEFISFIRDKVAVMAILNDDDFELKEVSERIKCLKVTESPTLFQQMLEANKGYLGKLRSFTSETTLSRTI